METVDIVVAGGGVAGLAAALAFGARGMRVLSADPGGRGDDLRTTAVLRPGAALLRSLGAWPEDEATPLAVMRVLDRPSGVARDFRAEELGVDGFGWNVPNRALLAALEARLAALPGVERRAAPVTARAVEGDRAVVAAGGEVAARLLIGADGRDSAVRRLAGIEADTWRTGQRALVCVVAHEAPHGHVSVEVHDGGGPFTLVPLSDPHRSSVVWMTDGVEAERLAAFPPDAFAEAATERSGGALGALTLEGGRQSWPVFTRLARRMTARRTALMAEAAHALPPIGAQGLNTSLADLAALLALADRSDLGADPWLAAYARAREADVRLRARAVAALNRASIGGLGPLRALGLRAAADVGPIRRGLMRLGLGAA